MISFLRNIINDKKSLVNNKAVKSTEIDNNEDQIASSTISPFSTDINTQQDKEEEIFMLFTKSGYDALPYNSIVKQLIGNYKIMPNTVITKETFREVIYKIKQVDPHINMNYYQIDLLDLFELNGNASQKLLDKFYDITKLMLENKKLLLRRVPELQNNPNELEKNLLNNDVIDELYSCITNNSEDFKNERMQKSSNLRGSALR